MSITSVNKQIKTAMKDSFITTQEAQKIVAEAEKGRLTVGEEKAVVELFEKAPKPSAPGMMHTMAIPEHPGDVTFEAGAKNVLETFFTKNDIPAGANKAKVLEQVKNAMAKGPLPELAEAPDVKKLHRVSIPSPAGLMDGPVRAAFIDKAKGEFYVSVSSMFRPAGAPMTKWFGPAKLEAEAPAPSPGTGKLSTERLMAIRGQVQKLETAGTLNWQMGGVVQSHLGVRFHSEQIAKENHPDGYTYTAFIPLGALTPTAPQKDPNAVSEVYIERTGGIAGLTQSVGPLTIGAKSGN
jgi:hypothetical protein